MRPSKPGVDWAQIKREYENGVSAYELGKRHDVTKQGILQKKTKEGWDEPVHHNLIDLDDLDRQVRMLPSVVHEPHYQGFRTAENAKTLIINRTNGLSLTGCAKLCGASTTNVVEDWRGSCEMFDALMSRAEGEFEQEHWGLLAQGSKRGDISATKTVLEKSDATKKQYAGNEGKSGGITVVFNNVPKPGEVIEHE